MMKLLTWINYLKKKFLKEKIGIFDIKNNKINHKLNLYKIEDKNLKKFLIFLNALNR